MSSYYKMARGWLDSEMFARAEYDDRAAWAWMVGEARWKDGYVSSPSGAPVFVKRGQIYTSIRFMAEKFGWSKDRVARTLKRFDRWGATATATATGQTLITICNYEEYQSDRDTPKDTDKDRVEDTPKDAPKDKQEERSKKDKKGNNIQGNFLPDFINPDDWKDFREMRIRLKKPMTDRAAKAIIKKLEDFKNQGHDVSAILEQSIVSSWQDVYEPKPANTQKGGNHVTSGKHTQQKASYLDKVQAAGSKALRRLEQQEREEADFFHSVDTQENIKRITGRTDTGPISSTDRHLEKTRARHQSGVPQGDDIDANDI